MSVFSVGFGNYVARGRVIAILSVDSSPVKRAVQEARKAGALIDATQGRKTKSVVYVDGGQIITSGLGPETLARRIAVVGAEDVDSDVG